MSTPGAIVNLGAELVVLVAASGLALVAVGHPEFLAPRWGARALLVVAAATLVGAAVAQGVAPDLDPGHDALVAVRLASAALLLAGSLAVTNSRARVALLAAVVLFAAAEGAYAADHPGAADALRAVAALGVGAAAATAARRSIATRIATASMALLLVVVVVLSGVLSAVITGNVADEALRRAAERAQIEAAFASAQADEAVRIGSLFSAFITSSTGFREAIASGEYGDSQSAGLDALRSEYRFADFVAFVDAVGAPRVSTQGVDQPELVELAGSAVVIDALQGSSAGSIERLGDGLVALGAAPVRVTDERGVPRLAGAAVAGVRLDDAFVAERLQEEQGTTLALAVSGSDVAASTAGEPGSVPDLVGDDLASRIEQQVLGTGLPVRSETRVGGEEAFVAVSPVTTSAGTPVAAFVVTLDGELVADTRTSLFRTLFLGALGAVVVALAFAAAAGARLARPVRRLTDAARRIAEGDLRARAGIQADDEIGVLGSSFDTMAEGVETMTREIREASAQTEAILDGMAEGLVATDAIGRVVALNPAAREMIDVEAAGAHRRPVQELLRVTDRDGASLDQRLAAGPPEQPWSATGFLHRGDEQIPVAISGAPIHGDDYEVIGAVYVLRDVRSEYEVERMKTEFLSNISHELRTPLTPIKGYAEMLLTKSVPKARARTFLRSVLQGAERLERYVDMLVNFAAMEAGRFTIEAQEVDVRDVARSVARRWQSSSDRHRVDTQLSSRMSKVMVDPGLLDRALNELMDNAIKYSPDGGTVTIAARARGTRSARRVEVSVSDEGIGIDEADLRAIFSDFAQLDGSSTRRYGGLGLGLSFVDRVVREHHGHLDAESRPGEGSTFTIVLPLAAAARTPSRPTRRARCR